jgi:hypothetical protein
MLKDCPSKAWSLSGVRWRRWRTHGEFIIGFSDQCELNYPLDRSRSGVYLRCGKQQHDIKTRTAMNLQIGDTAMLAFQVGSCGC